MSMFGRFTDTAQKAVVLAQEFARAHGSPEVNDVHLLASLTKAKGVGQDVLAEFGITVADVESLLGAPVPTPSRANINFSKGAKRTLELAFHAAQSLDHKYIGTEHLLLGLYDLNGGEAAPWLVERGITVEKVTGEVRARAGTPRKDETDANRQHVVSVRLDDDALRKIDALIKADLFKSRSEAAYFLIRKGLEAQAKIVDLVGERLGEIKKIQEELKRLFDEHTGS